jgi:uncharacterized protein (TIGR02444 family)
VRCRGATKVDDAHKHRAESPFWRFSLRFYGRPTVAEACLALQDGAGADVNLVLFLLFMADQKRQLGPEEVATLESAVGQWREAVVKPLRAVRRALKPGIEFIPGAISEGFRAQVKRLELESEQIEQHRLEEFAGIGSDAESRTQAAEANLKCYCATLANVPAAAVTAILRSFANFAPVEPPTP